MLSPFLHLGEGWGFRKAIQSNFTNAPPPPPTELSKSLSKAHCFPLIPTNSQPQTRYGAPNAANPLLHPHLCPTLPEVGWIRDNIDWCISATSEGRYHVCSWQTAMCWHCLCYTPSLKSTKCTDPYSQCLDFPKIYLFIVIHAFLLYMGRIRQ
jgi:hypothetical protein